VHEPDPAAAGELDRSLEEAGQALAQLARRLLEADQLHDRMAVLANGHGHLPARVVGPPDLGRARDDELRGADLEEDLVERGQAVLGRRPSHLSVQTGYPRPALCLR